MCVCENFVKEMPRAQEKLHYERKINSAHELLHAFYGPVKRGVCVYSLCAEHAQRNIEIG